MRRVRFVLRVAAGLGLLVAIVVVAAAVMFNSESFSRWLLTSIAARSDGVLRIESVAGTFGSGLRVGTVAVELESGSAVASAIDLQMDWRSLIARSLIVDVLHVQRLEVVVAQSESSSNDVEASELSTLVLIRTLKLDEIIISMEDSKYTIRDTAFELRLLRNRLEFNDVNAAYEQLALDGRAAFTLTEELAIEGAVCVNGTFADEQISGCIDAEGDLQAVQLDARFRMPFTFVGNGTVALAENGPIDLAASWQNANLAAVENTASPEGSLQLSGTLSRPRIDAAGTIVYGQETAEFATSAVINADDIDLALVRLVQGDTSVELSGVLTRTLETGEFELELRNFDPQRWVAEWRGSLDATARLALRTQPALEVVASDIVARGELRGYPIAALGALSFTDEVLTIDALQVVSRSDQITLAGRVASDLDVELEASIADLGIVGGDFSGAVSADLRITGSQSQPFVRGAIDLVDFQSGQLGAQTLQITGNAGLGSDDAFELSASAVGVRLSGASLDRATVNVTGTAAAHRIEAQLAADIWSSRLVSSGAIEDRDWSGRISELELVPGELGFWRLRVPAEVRYGPTGYSVSELCLTYELSSVCGAVSVAGTSEDALEVAAVNFDVSILEPFMPPNLRAKGLVNASGMLSNFMADPRGEIEFDAMDAQLDVQIAEGVILPVPIAEFEFAALLDDDGATLSVRVDAAETGSAAADFVVADPLQDESPLQGSLSLEWRDASALSLLSPDIDDVQGRIAANLGVGGTLAAPAFSGSANWSQGVLEVPAWGLLIDEIQASIEASEGREAVFSASGLVDSTPVEIGGAVLLDAEQGWPMQLELKGEDLSLVQLAEIEMRVSPSLKADIRLPDIRVSGSVGVPYARIRDVALPRQAVVPSSDAVIHGQALEDRGRPLDVVADLAIELGDEVTYEDANLTAAVTGRLDLDYRSGQGAAAQGALTLTGEYDAYGNPLALRRGQLIFVGPLNDPSLDILAVREIGEITAGVQLTGTLRSPITTLFSDPAMSETEALSWLLFARPLRGSQEADSSALRGAALSMGLQQALPVIERIGETLRLDDFAIRSNETDAGALMAGKYLSPNLYFRYTYGLFNRLGGLLVRYSINDRFSLETRSGENNSMDLLYTLEKD